MFNLRDNLPINVKQYKNKRIYVLICLLTSSTTRYLFLLSFCKPLFPARLMKKIVFLLMLLLSVASISAQETVPIAQFESEKYLDVLGSYQPVARFSVIYARRGDHNISQEVLDAGVYTLFYKLKDSGQYGMANISPTQQSLTYGLIYSVQQSTDQQDPIPTQIYTFEWDYQNTFDAAKGTYLVQFEMNNTGQGGTIAELRMTDTDADEVTVYKEATKDNFSVLPIK